MGGGLWRMFAKLSHARDQKVAMMRDEYLRFCERDRKAFRDWVDRLAVAGAYPEDLPGHLSALVQFPVQADQRYEVVEATPQTLSKAFAAWDAGKEYIHKGLEF